MTWTYIQSVYAGNQGVTPITLPTFTSTTGNLLVVSVFSTEEGPPTVTDNASPPTTFAMVTANAHYAGGVDIWCRQFWGVVQTGRAGHVISVALTAANYLTAVASEFNSSAGSIAHDTSAAASVAPGTGTDHFTSGLTPTTSQANELLVTGAADDTGSLTPTAGTGFTLPAGAIFVSGSVFEAAQAYRLVSSIGTYAGLFTYPSSAGGVTIVGTYTEAQGPTPTFEQEAYRWRNDDGSETAATWLAVQDTVITQPTLQNTRLRVLLDTAVADPATAARQLEWNRAAADAIWRPLEVLGAGALAFGAQGATTTAGTTAPTVAYPTGITKGQLLVMLVANRPNANTVATPAGWTLPTNGSAVGGAGVEGVGTGSIRGTVFIKEADGTETGTVTLAITGGTSVGAVMLRYTKTTGKAWNVAVVNGADSTAGTAYSATAGADPNVTAGDILLVGSMTCAPSTGTPAVASELVAQTGVTFGTMVERVDTAVTTGNDLHVTVSEHPVTSGTGSAAPVFTMTASGTNAASAAGISLFVRIRQVNLPVVLSPSANIAAGGTTATTAQLTAPAGKTTADFGVGDLSDDTNPLPTLDLALNQYTEDEWCLQATATALNTEVYQFRVTRAGTVMNTYIQTPQWTIGAAAVVASLVIPTNAMREVMAL